MPGCETTSDAATRRPRFPWVALALCVLSMGAAAWLWMRYSYRWDVAGKDLPQLRPVVPGDSDVSAVDSALEENPLAGRYVRFRGELVGGADPCFFKVTDPQGAFAWLLVGALDFPAKRHWAQREFVGRVVVVCGDGPTPRALPVIDIAAGRFTGASIAGLVVGAWGVFVFAAAFLHWRRPPGVRTSLEETRTGR